MTHPHPNRRFVPQAVLTRSGKINTAGASVNTAVRPVNTAGSKPTVNHPRPISNAYKKGYSQVTKPFNKYSANKNSIFNKKVNTVRVKDTTVRDRAVVSGNKGKGADAVKASACWVWKAKNSSASNTFKKYSYIDARGKSKATHSRRSTGKKHMTGNKCYLTEYEDYDGGFVSFGDGKSRISGKRTRDNIIAGQAEKKTEPEQEYILIPICTTDPLISPGPKDSEEDVGVKPTEVDKSEASDKDGKDEQDSRSEFERLLQQEKQTGHPNSTNSINTVSTPVSTAEPSSTNDAPSSPVNAAKTSKEHLFKQFSPFQNVFTLSDVPNVSPMDDNTRIFAGTYDDEYVGGQANLNNLETTMNKVWTLVDLPNGKRAIGTKWVFKNKKDERGIVVKNKARLVAQGYTQEEGIDYDEVFALVARIEAISIAGTRDNIVAGQAEKKTKPKQEYILLPICTTNPLISQGPKDSKEDAGVKPTEVDESEASNKDGKDEQDSRINAAKTSEEHLFGQFSPLKNAFTLPDVPNVSPIDDSTGIFAGAYNDEDVGYTQEEGIDYDEVFALVARIEAIRLFLAYTSYMGFIVYQMDVKSAFLYGPIEEEVYVCQPLGFEDPHFPDKVYKVEKALYGLHQAPRAWYGTLSTYLIENRFRRGPIDKTLFIKKDKSDILLVQVYVDDIIFGSTKKTLCLEFEQMMHKRFQMSSMGELTFFLGLQVQQKEDGIFISQDKYVTDILKKFDYVTEKTASTPMEPNKALVKDEEADNVDVYLYRSMIRSLMYLTASRPDITFVVCVCAIDSPFDLEAFSDSDYAGANLDRKSTTGGNGYCTKGQKQSKNGQNRALEWNEREKSKPKAYPF
ncbi:putative ribonuclease H-like domain-containing protein [Tanacetum coccineum]